MAGYNTKTIDYNRQMQTYLKGERGEEYITRMLENRGVRTVSNIYLKLGKNTTQIDKIILTPKGISILEIKNNGESIVTGNLRERFWNISYYGKRHKIYSPFMQNLSHICKLKQYIKDDRIYFYNFVLYSDDVKLNIKNDNKILSCGEYRCVNNFRDIDRICNFGDKSYSEYELDLFYNEFRKIKQNNSHYALEHINKLIGKYD